MQQDATPLLPATSVLLWTATAAGPSGAPCPGAPGIGQGARTFRTISRYCRDIGIEYLTVYAFSTENWKRPQEEIDAIMNLLRDYLNELERHSDEDEGVLRFIGDTAPLAEDLRLRIDEVQARTAGRPGYYRKYCFKLRRPCGDRAGGTAGSRAGRSGEISPDAVDEALVNSLLYTAGQPPVDLIIRPSGEQRLSNFMLWQGAYAELVFMDVLWPDFAPADLDRALEEYQRRSRRFGGIGS